MYSEVLGLRHLFFSVHFPATSISPKVFSLTSKFINYGTVIIVVNCDTEFHHHKAYSRTVDEIILCNAWNPHFSPSCLKYPVYHSKSSTKNIHMSIAGFIWTKCNSLHSKGRGRLLNHTTQQLLLTENQESHELHPCLSLALCTLGFSLLEKAGNWEDPVSFVSCHCSAVCNPWRNTSM